MRKFLTKAALAVGIAVMLLSCTETTVYETMPPMADWETAYHELMKKSGIKDDFTPEFFLLGCDFYQSSIPQAKHNDATITAEMISPDDKNKVYRYSYTLRDHKTHPKQAITLSAGHGKNAEKITQYEEFEMALFTRDFFPSFQDMESILKVAIEKSGITEDPRIRSFEFETNDKPEGQIRVKVGKGTDIGGTKYVYFDGKGNFKRADK